MKKILGLALAGALSVAALPAVAADYPLKAPPPPIWTWTGFYIGVQAGAGWDHQRWTLLTLLPTGNFVGSGGLVGGTIGYNWQMPASPWVLGIEADAAFSNMIGQSAALACLGPLGTCRTNVQAIGTIRARLGYANGPILFYVTGGGAWASVNEQWTVLGVGLWNSTNGVWGWSAGAGLEGALGGGWSVKAEYIYADFGQVDQFTVLGFPVQNVDYLRVHMLRAGLNYKF